NKAITRLYTNPLADGGANLITNRGLAKNTACKTDTKVVVNGQTYYRFATHDWVKDDDEYLSRESSRSVKIYTNNAPDAEVTDTYNNNNGGSSNNSGSGSTTTPEAKTATVTVKYVDENDKEIATAKTLEDKQIGSTVTEKAIDVDGYTLTSDA